MLYRHSTFLYVPRRLNKELARVLGGREVRAKEEKLAVRHRSSLCAGNPGRLSPNDCLEIVPQLNECPLEMLPLNFVRKGFH